MTKDSAVTVYTNREEIDSIKMRLDQIERLMAQLVKNDRLTRGSLQELRLDVIAWMGSDQDADA